MHKVIGAQEDLLKSTCLQNMKRKKKELPDTQKGKPKDGQKLTNQSRRSTETCKNSIQWETPDNCVKRSYF